MVLQKLWLLGITTSVKCASLMVVSSVTTSGLLLWTAFNQQLWFCYSKFIIIIIIIIKNNFLCTDYCLHFSVNAGAVCRQEMYTTHKQFSGWETLTDITGNTVLVLKATLQMQQDHNHNVDPFVIGWSLCSTFKY